MRRGMSDVALPGPVEAIRARNALVEALSAIAGGGRDADPLESALATFRTAAGSLNEGDVVWAFAELVEALAHAVRWTDAAWNAEQDAARHATAARLRAGGTSLSTHDRCNTTIEIVTFDPGTATPLNMPTAALRLQQMMSELNNALPKLDTNVRRDARLLLEAVATFAHTVLDYRLGQTENIDEAWFQRELRSFLQANPQIGARLGEHVRRAGGLTDLVLGEVVLELKVEKDSAVSLDAVRTGYVSQSTQYASAGDCRVSLLAVLDVSRKRAPAGVMGNEMGWAYPETTSGQDPPFPSLVGVVVVRAGFPRPSDFSRYNV